MSAQYESYILPLAVLLSVPFGLMGSFVFVNGFAALGSIPALKMILGSMSNDIYMQIALIMLMGLLAKNAILIVEFALDRRKQGMSISWAAVLGAAARLRPILMTSLAMIVGLIPLMLAMGVGAHGNRTLGASAIGGMLIGMIFQILIVPVLFVVFQWLQEKIKPMEWDSMDESEVETKHTIVRMILPLRVSIVIRHRQPIPWLPIQPIWATCLGGKSSAMRSCRL